MVVKIKGTFLQNFLYMYTMGIGKLHFKNNFKLLPTYHEELLWTDLLHQFFNATNVQFGQKNKSIY